jgi:DNA-binding response OmpR family regulator
MDRIRRRVTRLGQPIELTATEFNLLEFMLLHPDEVLARNRIAEEVWGYHFEASTNIVDVYINYLRKKLDQPFSEKLIQTVRGVGYALRKEEPSD